MGPLRRAVHLVSFRPHQFWVGSLAWITYFLYPIIPGVVLARAFTEIEHRGSAVLIGALLVGLFAAELCVRILLRIGHRTYMEGFEAARPTSPPSGWMARALTDFRVLLLDQRGTGGSTPVGPVIPGATGSDQIAAGAASPDQKLQFHLRLLPGPEFWKPQSVTRHVSFMQMA